MFDTRAKILSSAGLLAYAQAHPELPIVAGYFDPMWAPHAARLKELAGARKLLVLVAPKEGALLSDRARAELVASFGVVERVAIVSDEAAREKFGPRVVDERQGDEERYRALAEHVRKRNNV